MQKRGRLKGLIKGKKNRSQGLLKNWKESLLGCPQGGEQRRGAAQAKEES